MIKKIGYLGVIATLIASIIACEKDFRDIGSSVINNNQFNTNQIELEVEITPIDVEAVRADNIELGNLGDYLLGVYKKDGAKTIEASIVSQLLVPSNLNSTETLGEGEVASSPVLDEVILKIPLQSTYLRLDTLNTGEIVPLFRIDSLLGNTNEDFNINVYKNGTYLSSLDPTDPSKRNSYQSNANYIKLSGVLNTEKNTASFNTYKDSIFTFYRTVENGVPYKDTLKVTTSTNSKAIPFIALKLDKNFFKSEIFDKYNDANLASQELFNDYFRGIIIETVGQNGALFPMNLSAISNNFRPSIDFFHTSTVTKDGVVTDTIEGVNSFYLGGISNSLYKMTNASTSIPNNSFVIQGTSGSMAKVDILGGTDIEDLRSQNILINDASLTFYINGSIDSTQAPLRLLAFKNNNGIGSHIKDSYTESALFDGNLQSTSDGKPEKYTLRIRDYISDLIKGETNYNPPLMLKVYNTNTDRPLSNNALDTIVKTYNWNPRSITLLNHLPENGTKRAKLVISYTEEK